MTVQVYLGSGMLEPTTPEQVPALLALARGLGLPWHPDPVEDTLYIAPPLARLAVSVMGDASGGVFEVLRHRLETAGAQVVGTRDRAEVCLLLEPMPEKQPRVCFSLRRPLVSWRLAQGLAAAVGGSVGFRPWLEAPGWCPTVRLLWDPSHSADELAVRVVAGLARCFAAPLPPLVAKAFSALARASSPRDASPSPRDASPSPRDASPPQRDASPPERDASPSPLWLGTPQQREAVLAGLSMSPPPFPKPSALDPPGDGVTRVFNPKLRVPAAAPPNVRAFPRETRTTSTPVAAFTINSQPSGAKSFRRHPAVKVPEIAGSSAREREPVGRGRESREGMANQPPADLHVFRVSPAARVPG